jgi:site-specific DNA-methyltransferase (adenine-specific)
MDDINISDLSRIAQGDCLELMKDLPDNSVDLLLTDPPYNLGQFMHKRGTNIKGMRDNHFAYSGWDNLNFNEWSIQMSDFLKECSRVVKNRGTLLMFMSIMKVETIINLAIDCGFYYKTVGIWHKTNPMPRNMNLQFVNSTEAWLYFINNGTTGTFNNNGKVVHDFIQTATISPSEHKTGNHPTQKPVRILEHFIKLLSNKGDLVFDPFMGSGSTGVAAEHLDRKFLGFELDDKYFEISKKRIISKL